MKCNKSARIYTGRLSKTFFPGLEALRQKIDPSKKEIDVNRKHKKQQEGITRCAGVGSKWLWESG